MAIVKILMEKGLVQKVLFLADRKALRNQAMIKGFKQFFPEESKGTIFAGKYEKRQAAVRFHDPDVPGNLS